MDKVSVLFNNGPRQFSKLLLDKNTLYMFIVLTFASVFFSSYVPSVISRHIDNPLVKFCVLVLIVYLTSVNPSIAVLVTIAYLISYNNCASKEAKENFQQIETFQQIEQYENDSEDSLDPNSSDGSNNDTDESINSEISVDSNDSNDSKE